MTEILSNFFILDNVPSQIFWKDREGFYLGCNKAFLLSLGVDSREHIIGKNDLELPVERYISEQYMADDQAVMNRGIPIFNKEEKQEFLDGRVRFLITNKIPIFKENLREIVGVLGVYTDITELAETRDRLEKSLEEQSKIADKVKDTILSNFRHDWVTPMCGLDLLDHIAQKQTDPEDRELCHMIYKSNHALIDHLKGVQEMVEALDGSLPLTDEIINCYEILKNVYVMYKSEATRKKLNLVMDVNEHDWQHEMRGDKERITRILMTLLSNAVNFTKEGGTITLFLSMKEKANGDVVVNFLVKDTGIGISEDDIKDIYTTFYKVKPSYNNSDLSESGSGTGLAIARRYADDIEGQLSCESVVGKGSVFAFSVVLRSALISRDELKSALGSSSASHKSTLTC